MKTYKKHYSDELDNHKGSWRPALVASIFGADGHPIAWQEIVVVCCHGCGAQFGVGAEGDSIQADGSTSAEATCYHCKHTEHMTFEHFDQPKGREHFAKLKVDAGDAVKETRMRNVKEVLKKQMQEELDARAHEAAKAILPDDAPDHDVRLRNFLKRK